MAKKKATIPKDVQIGLKKLADATKKNVKDMVAELKKIMKEDDNIQVMKEKEAKIRFAWAILASRYSISDGDPFYFRAFTTPRVRKTTNSVVGDLYGVVQEIVENDDGEEELGDIHYVGGTFWRDAAKTLNKIQTDQVYRATFRTTKPKKQNGQDDFGLIISGNNPNFKKTDEVELPDAKEFYEEHIEPLNRQIEINEMDINEKQHDLDFRTFRVTVLKAEVREGSKGEYAYYDVVDDSILGHRTHRIFVNPEDLKHGQSSILHVVGDCENLDNGGIRYTNHFIVPEYSIPLNVIPKKVQSKDAVDINLDDADDEPEDEEPTEQEDTNDEEEEEQEQDEDETEEDQPDEQPEDKPKKKKSKKEKEPEEDEEEDDEGSVFAV